MDEKISPEVQKLAAQLQQQQQQLRNISLQKQSFSYQKVEIENALEELKNVKENEEVFKVVGPILIKKSKEEIEKELRNTLDKIDGSLKMIEMGEEKLKESVLKNQEKVEKLLRGENTEDKK